MSLKNPKSSQELLNCIGIVGIAERTRRGGLRWFGHVEQKSGDDWVCKCSAETWWWKVLGELAEE
jgi:hypothetical protein